MNTKKDTETEALIENLNRELPVTIPVSDTSDAAREKLKICINQLINTNFEKLILILYRIDVSELKIKALLHQFANIDAAEIITELIIERELEKIKSGREFSQRDQNISDDERW